MARDVCKVDRCVLKNRQRLIFHQLVHQTGLTLVEPLGVKGFRESEKLVVQMVAELMHQGPQESSEGDEPILQPCTKDLDGFPEQKNRSVPNLSLGPSAELCDHKVTSPSTSCVLRSA